MRYFETGGSKFVENGKGRVRVELVCHKKGPVAPERTLKVFQVAAVLTASNTLKPPEVGSFIALSFPNTKVNAKEYEWYKDGWEECFVPLKFDEAKARARRNIRSTTPVSQN